MMAGAAAGSDAMPPGVEPTHEQHDMFDGQSSETSDPVVEIDTDKIDNEEVVKFIKQMQKNMKLMNDKIAHLTTENNELKYAKADTKTPRNVFNPNADTVKLTAPKGEQLYKPDVDLIDLDKKDVEPPVKYAGDVSKWRHWFQKLRTFLARRDPRWPKLLDTVNLEEICNKPITEDVEVAIFKGLNVNGEMLRNKFKAQFYEYLETYTTGLAHGTVMAGGTKGCMEVFRQFCDEGQSKRPRHLRKEYRGLMHPKQATFETLKKAIMEWETDLAHHQIAAAPWTMADRDRIMCLEDMCPDLLQQHLEALNSAREFAMDYSLTKTAINDYIANKYRWATTKQKINWLGNPDGNEEIRDPGDGEHDENAEFMNTIAGEIMAIVKGKFNKKGLGKGGKGGKAPQTGMDVDKDERTCHECGELITKCGHFARDCPLRQARIAAGGPPILGKGEKGKGKGKKGGNTAGKGAYPTMPTKGQWNQFYPGPSQQQWRSWYPQGQAAIKGGANLFEAPWQLSSIQPQQPPANVFQNLFSDGTCYSIVEKRRPVKLRNSFDALAKHDDVVHPPDEKVIEVNIMDVIKKPSPNKNKTGKKHMQRQKTSESGARSCAPTDEPAKAKLHKSPSTSRDPRGALSPPAVVNTPAQATDRSATLANILKFAKTTHDSKQNLNMFNEVLRHGSLRPCTELREVDTKKGKFEIMSAVVDSGATVPVMSPNTGKAYELLESEASRRGVEYELANEDTLPNLGEKKMAVMTQEGTIRGYTSQCADVSKSLQAVRSLVSSKHAVCFGLGDGNDHLIINKVSGEVNRMRDDGINYLQDLLVIPPDKVKEVATALNEDISGQDFGWQGR